MSEIIELFGSSKAPLNKQLSSCLSNESQPFCHKHKIIVPNEFKQYYDLLLDTQKSGLLNIKRTFINIILGNFQFRKTEGEFLNVVSVSRNKWKRQNK